MTKDVLAVGAVSLALACVLLGLRQLFVKGGKLRLRKAAFGMSVGQKYERTLAERIERTVFVTAGDLSLFVSLCAARLMVWHAVRRRDRRRAKERAARLKHFGHALGNHVRDESLLMPEGVARDEGEAPAAVGEPQPLHSVR